MFAKNSRFLQRYCQLLKKRYYCYETKNKSLLKHIQSKIKFSGPITIHEYMKEVLTNPIFGYYSSNNDVFGEKGDFITSPDVSSMFGELIAHWLYSEWHTLGSPKPFQLIELGPGKGTLMKDVLTTLKRLQVIKPSDIQIHMVEKSLSLSNVQESTLCNTTVKETVNIPDDLAITYKSSHTPDGVPIHWHYHLSDVPVGFSMIFSNELFDALPVHKLIKTKNGWREILIDIKELDSTSKEAEELRYVISRGPTPASKLLVDPEEKREEVEVCPEAGLLVQQLANRITENGGAVLIIDYGHNGTVGDTFRAFKNHTQVSPLSSPGHADLTCDVDFSYLKKQVKKDVLVYGPVQQGFFLKNLGIEIMLTNMLQSCTSEDEYAKIMAGYKMLVEPQNMGEKFKVMALYPAVMQELLMKYPPPGFYKNLDDDM